MLNNTPAKYKKEFPYFKEVDSLELTNAQLNLQKAYKGFFNNPKNGFPKFKSKKNSWRTYTTNSVNNNIELKEGRLKLPKLGLVKIKQHREIPQGYKLKSVTVSQSGSWKIFASILFEYEQEEILKSQRVF